MIDLKGPYDVVNAAEAAWKQQAADISALLEQGTDEATQQALKLQEPLDTLQADYEAKLALYQSLVKANAPSDVAKNFVPVSATPATPDASAPVNVMKLQEFQDMTPADRMKFVKGGGKVED
jgi:hypothetical protein